MGTKGRKNVKKPKEGSKKRRRVNREGKNA